MKPKGGVGGGVRSLTFGSVEAVGDSVSDLVSVQLSVSVGESPLSPVTAAGPLGNTNMSSAYWRIKQLLLYSLHLTL